MKGGGVPKRGLDRRMQIGAWSARVRSDAGTPRAAWKPWRLGLGVAVALVALLAVPAISSAHVERASYWPDPKPDCSITPCAGGEVPSPRSLASATVRKYPGPGTVRVVCQEDSIKRLNASISVAKRTGYRVRPTEALQFIGEAEARALRSLNSKLKTKCAYSSIQAAVDASHNNDRVVIMPGLYTEQHSREQPTHDPACSQYLIKNDREQTGAVSYAYQYHCPNDQNLIAVLGREPAADPPPDPPLEDRHGIPDLGPCVRCNLQMDGSGVAPDDVTIDAGDTSSGDHAPINPVKDVGIRADRADGFILRNVKVRHAAEHDIYVLESDGYLLDRFRTFYAGEYGVLTFVEDHGLMQNCDAAGNGDSGLYPGASADTGNQRDTGIYPDFRYSQEIRFCDSHHNAGGYSGTDGNAVHVDKNNFYDNALGFTTDVFTAPGHPGFPQDSDLIEDNNFYDNNFNPYAKGSDVVPDIPVPVGTGLWIAGGNDNLVRRNHFYDNYRRGVMLFAAPDATICGPPPVGSKSPVPGCDPSKVSTSYRNSFTANLMGTTPGGETRPNGTDF